jgi:hypothetical protein
MRLVLILLVVAMVVAAATLAWMRGGEEPSTLGDLPAEEVLRRAAAANGALQTVRADLLIEVKVDDSETTATRVEMMLDRIAQFVLIRGDLKADSPTSPYSEQFFDGSSGKAYTRQDSGSEWMPEYNMYVLSGVQALLKPEVYEESPHRYGIERQRLSSGERVYHVATSNLRRSFESYISEKDFRTVQGTLTFEIVQSGFRIWNRFSYTFYGFNEPIVFPPDLPKP